MALSDLFPLAGPVLVSGITLDSRLVRPGDLYVALPGRRHHGAEFAAQAVGGGAAAVLTDRAGAQRPDPSGCRWSWSTDPRREMAGLAAAMFGRPAAAMADVRDHRHQREDHHHFPVGCGAPERRSDAPA